MHNLVQFVFSCHKPFRNTNVSREESRKRDRDLILNRPAAENALSTSTLVGGMVYRDSSGSLKLYRFRTSYLKKIDFFGEIMKIVFIIF